MKIYVRVLKKPGAKHIGIFRVTLPDFNEPGNYRQGISESAFFCPRRYTKTKYGMRASDLNSKYYFHRYYEFDWPNQKHSIQSVRDIIGDQTYYSDIKVYDIVGLYNFYNLIGWDRKTLKFSEEKDMDKFFSDLTEKNSLTWDQV